MIIGYNENLLILHEEVYFKFGEYDEMKIIYHTFDW